MRWDYTIRGYAGVNHKSPFGAKVLETVHKGATSRDVEIAVYRSRMARGEISRIEVLDHANAKTETIYR
jgi:hypothetical protein